MVAALPLAAEIGWKAVATDVRKRRPVEVTGIVWEGSRQPDVIAVTQRTPVYAAFSDAFARRRSVSYCKPATRCCFSDSVALSKICMLARAARSVLTSSDKPRAGVELFIRVA